MAKLATFCIPLRGVKQGTDNYEFLLDDEFFREMESIDILAGAVKASLAVRRANEANYFSIHCQGTIQIVCDRCLEPMDYAVEANYDLAVKYGDEYDDSKDGVLIVPESDNVLDVAPIVYDTVALCIPLQHVHAEGECDEATWQALQAHTAHGVDGDESEEYGSYADDDSAASDIDNETNIDPRWAELMKLKDNKLKNK